MSGGLKAVSPLISEALAMKVWLPKNCSVSPNTSLLPGGADWMPTGTGVERGSTTVSEMAERLMNQSSPKIGRSPLSVFWL